MRYSKVLLAIVLISMLVFGSTMSTFAVGETYNLKVFVAEGSTGMGTVTGGGDYAYDADINVSAIPAAGHEFVGWELCFNYAGMNALAQPASFTFNAYTLKNDYVPKVFLRANFKPIGSNSEVIVHYINTVPVPDVFLAPEIKIRGIIGNSYVTVAKEFAGFELISTPTNATGIFTATQGHIDYMYKAAVIPVNYTVSGMESPEDSGIIEGLGEYIEGAEVTLTANPEMGYNFVEWDFDPQVITATVDGDEITFMMPEGDVEVNAIFEDAPSVLATIKYVNTSAVSIQPDTQVLLLNGPYTQNAPAISGYQHIYSSPNRVGTVGDGDGDFVITHVYQVPPTPQVITNTVTETVYVNVPATTVPATTAPATTEVITTEAVPLGAPGPLNFDEFVQDETLPATEMTTEAEEVMEEEVPLAEALPQTGQLSVEMFYGVGGLVSGLGLWLKRRK